MSEFKVKKATPQKVKPAVKIDDDLPLECILDMYSNIQYDNILKPSILYKNNKPVTQ